MSIVMNDVVEILKTGNSFKGERRSLGNEPLKNLLSQAKDLSISSNDEKANSLWFDNDFNLHYQTKSGEKSNKMSYWGFTQVCKKAGVPLTYVNKCIQGNDPELAVYNLNRWLERESDKLIQNDRMCIIKEFNRFETDDTIVCGVVSDRFSNIETVSVLNDISQSAPKDLSVVGSFMDMERLHLRMASLNRDIARDRLKKYGEKGAGLVGGIAINNSEVGQSALTVNLLLYRLACTNGMITTDKSMRVFSKHHMGLTRENFTSSMLDLQNTMSNFEGIMGDKVINAIEANITDAQQERMLKAIKKDANLTEPDMEKIKICQQTRYKDFGKLWGLINAMTDASHEFDVDKRELTEKVSHSILMNANKY